MTDRKPAPKRAGRPKGSKNRVNQAFEKAYQLYAKDYCDPVEFLFRVMSGADQSEDWGTARIQAAIALVNRKVPALKAVDIKTESTETTQLVIKWEDDDSAGSYTIPAETASEATTH